MMRLILFLFGMSLFAAAPTNQLIISDLTSDVQTDRPTRFGRPFAAGEIWGYPQPIIDDTPATSWQVTVQTRHRDGSSTCTVTDATNEYPITVTCADHGYRDGDWVTIVDVTGNAAANGRHRIVRRGRHTFFLQGATGDGSYSSGGSATGPGLGSVRFAVIVIDDDVDLEADGSVTVTFQDSADACHLGNQATCEAAALSEAEMLAWDSSGWGAEIEATQGNTYTANARTMIDAGDFEYWIAGPILTTVIVRDHTTARGYDFGWECLTNCTTDYASATWQTDTTNKSLSPIFVLSFYDARPAAVKIEYILENIWYGHLQDQRLSLVLNSDSSGSTEEYTKGMFTQYAKTRWRKVFWDGVEPGAINIDHNEASWEYSGAVPVWMDDVEPAQVDIDWHNDTSTCPDADFDINGNGCYNKYFPTSGARNEIGMFSLWDSAWLQTFDSGIWTQVWNNGNVSGHIPIHYREASTDATLYFVDVDADGGTDNDDDDNEAGNGVFGRIFSIDAHPEDTSSGGNVATLSSSHGWTVDWAHQSGFAYVPYLATGEWYLMEEMQFWSARNLGRIDEAYTHYGRGETYGILAHEVQTRGVGWAGRNLLRSAWASPDGTVEKEYLTNKSDFNLMSHEGRFAQHFHGVHYLPLIGDSDDAPCSSRDFTGTAWTQKNPYCFGYRFSNQYNHQYNPLGVTIYNSDSAGCDSLTSATKCDSPWMQDYLISGFYGHGKDLGFRTSDLLLMAAKWRFQFLHEDHNPYLTFTYRVPTILTSTGTYPSSPALSFGGYSEAGQTKDAFNQENVYWSGNYGLSYIYGTLPYLTDGRLSGIDWRDAWSWYTNESNVENTDTRCLSGTIGVGCTTARVETRSNIGPRFDATVIYFVTPGDTFSIWGLKTPAWDSTCTIDGNDVGQTGRYREYVLTGLSASTGYEHVLSCSDDPWGSETVSYSTTAEPEGTADFSVRVGVGDTTTSLHWGYTISMTETPVSESCSSGCLLTIVDANRGLIRYQIRHADGRTGSITQANLQ